MRILNKMPSLETPAQRADFYQWWGKETTVINAVSKHCHYSPYRQRLSIKCAFGGAEHYEANNQQYRVEDDRYLLLGEGCVTESFIGSDFPVNSFSIFFGPSALSRLGGASMDKLEAVLAERGGLRSMDGEIGALLRRIWRRTKKEGPDMLDLEATVDELLVALATHELEVAGLAEQSGAARRKLVRARDYIECCYPNPVTLNDVASAAALSPFHLSRAFKEAFGLSPMAYLKRKRVEAAERLIRTNDCSIGEAAARVGFVSRATFVRQFVKRFGRLPSER